MGVQYTPEVTRMQSFNGECVGVRVERRAFDGRAEFIITVEDDGVWHDKVRLSSGWLDETITQLQSAKAHLLKVGEADRYGFTLPEPAE